MTGTSRAPGTRTAGAADGAAPGEWITRAGRWIGSWSFAAGTLVLVALALLLTYRQGGDFAALDAVFLAVVLVELPLVALLLQHADRTATELAIHHLESDRRMAAEIRELGDTEARLAVELARLNARWRVAEQRRSAEAEQPRAATAAGTGADAVSPPRT